MAKDKKYQIFISSTYLDLIEERQMAVQSIIKMGHIPAGMELFKAGASQWQTITKWIDESDIYVLILGGRYGSINEHEGKSYTQLEYEYALSKGIPVFAIVLKDDFLQEKENNKKDDKIEIFEKENIEKYNKFKKLVLSKVVAFAEDIKDIQIEIPNNVNTIARERKLEGWSKGSDTESYIDALKENMLISKEKQKLMQENQKLKEKIKKLEEDKKDNFSCKLSFEELQKSLEKEIVIIPKDKLGNKEELKRSVLVLGTSLKKQLASGVSNSGLSSDREAFICNNIASVLASYGLCDVKKASGKLWSTITLNSDGKKFLALLNK